MTLMGLMVSITSTIILAMASIPHSTESLTSSVKQDMFFIPYFYNNTPPVIRIRLSSPDQAFEPVPAELRDYVSWDYRRIRNTALSD